MNIKDIEEFKTNINNIENEKKIFPIISIRPNILQYFKKTENNNINNINVFYIINEEIYNKIKGSIFYNQSEILEDIIYVVTNGKIILKYKSLSSDNIKNNNILVGKINDDNTFIYEIIIIYKEEDNNEINLCDILNELKNNIDDLHNKDNVFKINGNIIGKIYKNPNLIIENRESSKPLNNNNNDNNGNNNIDEEKNNIFDNIKNIKYIELLINIYTIKLYLKQQINKPINNESKLKKYILINKKWMKKLLEFCKFDKFIEIVNKNNIDNIINEYNFDIDILINKIIPLFPSDYLNNLNEEENKDILKYLKNIEHFEPKFMNYYDVNYIIYYYDSFEIIDKKGFEIIKEIFDYKIECKERNFLIGDMNIIMDLILYDPYKQYNILIFSVDKNNDYEILIDIILNFKEEKYIKHYLNKFNKNGLSKFISQLTFDKEIKSEIKSNTDGNVRGMGYKISNNISKSINKDDNNNLIIDVENIINNYDFGVNDNNENIPEKGKKANNEEIKIDKEKNKSPVSTR